MQLTHEKFKGQGVVSLSGEYGADGSQESHSTFASSIPSCDDKVNAEVSFEGMSTLTSIM